MKCYASDDDLLLLLVGSGLLSAEQKRFVELKKGPQRHELLRKRLPRGKKAGKLPSFDPDLVDVLVSLKMQIPGSGKPLTEEVIVRAVAKQKGLPFKKLDPLELDINVVTKTIPQSFAVKHMVLPFAMKDGVLEVAIYDPSHMGVLEEIERVNQLKVRPYLTTRSDINKILAEFYGFQTSISAAEDNLGGPLVDIGNLEQYVRIASTSEEAALTDRHIQSAVDHLFGYAFEQRASDIHIEPKRDKTVVRLRIDGALHTIYALSKVVHPAIVSRVKFLSRLDITEKRRPQDGRIKVDRDGKQAEIRVSSVPVAFGEKLVLRILDPEILFQKLDHLGLAARDYTVFQDVIRSPYGIFLVTGPTGSGKSTTLYSTLKHVSSSTKNIITVEDPVEMICEEFNQISVQPQVDITFPSILRSILRQDPDIIMIGEIRDRETAAHAAQAALTGHLVLSTLHTNDAVSSVTRLLDLGVQPFLAASTMIGVMAQRLVRKICDNCRQPVAVPSLMLRGFGQAIDVDSYPLQQGTGCRQCRKTGYYGRCGIFEIFQVSEEIKTMISDGRSEVELRRQAISEGMTTLRDDAWRKVQDGVTTAEEALRVLGTV